VRTARRGDGLGHRRYLAVAFSLCAGTRGHTTAWGAGHDIQLDRPELVIASVRRLVEAARTD
jgi:hypothetical protein